MFSNIRFKNKVISIFFSYFKKSDYIKKKEINIAAREISFNNYDIDQNNSMDGGELFQFHKFLIIFE